MAYLPPTSTNIPTEDWDDGDFILAHDESSLTVPKSRQTSSSSTMYTSFPVSKGLRPTFPEDPFEEDDLTGFDESDNEENQGTLKLKNGIPSIPQPNAKKPSAGKAGFISLDKMKAMQALGQTKQTLKPSRPMQNLEDDFDDFHDDGNPSFRTSQSIGDARLLVKPKFGKEPDWDDFDTMTDDDETGGTLKVNSGTLKGLKSRYGMSGGPLVDVSNQNQQKGIHMVAKPTAFDDDDVEADFALPLTLDHLKLASRKEYPATTLRHRTSRSSLLSTTSRSDWDKEIGDGIRSSHFASPSTSSTSITSGSMPVTDHSEVDIHAKSIMVADEDEDFEQDLVLPTTSFFSTGRTRELNSLLDSKRRSHLQNQPHGQNTQTFTKQNGTYDSSTFKPSRLTRATISSAAKSRYDPHEEAFEDGLVLEEEGAELNQTRLSRLRKARLPPATPSKSLASGYKRDASGRGGVEGGDLFRERRTSGKIENPEGKTRKVDSGRVMVDAISSMPSATGPFSPHRLRPRKSHSRLNDRLAPSPGPSLIKKQSLASLRDAMAQNGEHGGVPSYVAPTASSAARQAAKSRERFSEAAHQPLPPSPNRPRTPSDREQNAHRQTVPVSASKSKSRPAVGSAFIRPSSSASNPCHSTLPHSFMSSTMTVAQVLKKPKNLRTYGDGTELEGFDDLVVDRSKEGSNLASKGSGGGLASYSYVSGLPNGSNGNSSLGLGRPPMQDQVSKHVTGPQTSMSEKRKRTGLSKATSGSTPIKTERKKAGLIRHLGKVEKKQVGEMTWNPQTLRWEGNYGVLRDFDNALGSSVRPALIAYRAPIALKPASPVDKGNNTASNAVRVVGNMMFDPEKMCWISTLSADEEDPDPFEGMADDEDDSFWQDRKGGTLTKGMFKGLELPNARMADGPRRYISDVSTSFTSSPSTLSRSQSSEHSEEYQDVEARVDLRQGRNLMSGKSLASSFHADRTLSMASSRHAESNEYDMSNWTWVDEELFNETKLAEKRHAQETKQWFGADERERQRISAREGDREKDRTKRREEKRLWEIRHLVMDG